MIKEHTIIIETSVVRDADEFTVRVAYDGKQCLELGPLDDKHQAHDLAAAITKSARIAIDYVLQKQQFPIKVPA
jgi:hypothetical protein